MKLCRACGVEKPLFDFWLDRRRGPKPRCISCCRKAQQAYYTANGDRLRKTARDKYGSDPWRDRERHLVRKYGVNEAGYAALLAQQDGCCAICSALEIKQKNGRLHVDHDHATGVVRGLLCISCNRMLGFGKDSADVLRRGAAYLECQA